MIKILLIIIAGLLSSPVWAAEIFSENYDAISDGWDCSDSIPSGWTGQASCPSSNTYNSVTHYAGEITSGGRSGNSLKLWRRNGLGSVSGWEPGPSYIGYLDKTLTSDEFSNHYKELYIRWYIKIPTAWEASLGGAATHKLNRAYFGTSAGSTSGEWYLDVKSGDGFTDGKLSLYNTDGGGVWYSSSTIAQLGINDGDWHCIEWRLRLGGSDGGFQIFIDGNAIEICDGSAENCSTNHTNMSLGVSSSAYFTTLAPPAIGNLTDGTWDFPTDGWYAIEFDDYVVSTTYIGPTESTEDGSQTLGTSLIGVSTQ